LELGIAVNEARAAPAVPVSAKASGTALVQQILQSCRMQNWFHNFRPDKLNLSSMTFIHIGKKAAEPSHIIQPGLAYVPSITASSSASRARSGLGAFFHSKGTFLLDLFLNKSLVRNRVTPRVGDADNFRLYHMPGFGWRGPFKFRHVPTNQKGAKSPNEIAAAGVLTSPNPNQKKFFAFSCQTR
jgi:hypothetical protein